MAESTLSRGYDQIVVIIADYIGKGRTFADLTSDEQNRVDEAVQSGIRQFYFPPPLPGPDGQSSPPHKWSFLQTTSTITLSVGTEAYDLPDNYGGGITYLIYPDGANKARINVISLQHFLTIGANTTGNNQVRYAAVRPKTTIGSTGQRFEILLNPKPDTTQTLTFEFEILPDIITTTNDFPYGGMPHAETVVASCLAMAEERTNDESGLHAAKFIHRLTASVAYDQLEWARIKAMPYPQTTPTDLTIQYTDLQREAGRGLKYAPDPIAWSNDETEEVDGLIHDGLRRFYYPPVLEGDKDRHGWSFLNEVTTITVSVATGFDIDLPTDFGGVLGELTYAAASTNRVIRIIDEVKLRTLKSNENTAAAPFYAAVRPLGSFSATTGQRWELLVHPVPNATYVLSYKYPVIPARLTTTNLHPRGGEMHGETILASVMAEVELRTAGQRGPRNEVFLGLLAGSVDLDRRSLAVTADTAIVAETASTQSAVYTDLVRDVGAYLGFGRNSNLFSTPELNQCDDIVQRGLRQFYNPPPVRTGERAYSWKFLRPVTTIVTVSGDSDYDLPSGFSSMHGKFTYEPNIGFGEIPVINEQELRSMQARGTNVGKPHFAAIRTKTYTGSVDPLFEVLFDPTPDSPYTLTFCYNLIAPRITSVNLFPIGGNIHAETIRKSCLAAAEMDRNLGETIWQNAFMLSLAGSIDRDRTANTPEYHGQNLDFSDVQYAGLIN